MINRLIPVERYHAFLWKGEVLCLNTHGRRKYIPTTVHMRGETLLPSCLKGSRCVGHGFVVKGRHGTGAAMCEFTPHQRTRLRRVMDSIRAANVGA